jgi:hypothetical protein
MFTILISSKANTMISPISLLIVHIGKTFPRELLLRQPTASSFTGAIGSNYASAYPSIPFS